MKTYPVNDALMHDGKFYARGETVTLDDEAAARFPDGLLGDGTDEPEGKSVPQGKSGPKSERTTDKPA